MHTLVEVPVGANGGTHVPAFLAKLWKIVDDPTTNDLICWSEMGNSFIIKNQAKFARDLLPLYYKHNNMASFVRQLNMYGFHKVVSVEQGGLRVDKDEMEFAHLFFLKGQEASLELIKRKIPASKHEESRVRPDSLNKVLLDVRQMKGRQETMDNKLLTMKRENEALWRELASLRQKHAKQTQIVSKLLQFLVGMMSQQTPRLAFKRRMPLMLNDKEGVKQKLSRTDTSEPTGPVIHDVTELLESDESVETMEDQECNIMSVASSDLKSRVDSPLSVHSKSPYSETIVGGRESPELFFSVDPTTINPAITVPGVNAQLQTQKNLNQNKQQQAKGKGKAAVKRNPGPSVSLASIKTEANVGFPSTQSMPTQNIMSSQLEQVSGLATIPSSSQPQNTVPTTLFFSAPGMAEPVQVVLSIPDQNSTTVPSTSTGMTVSAPSVAPTTSTTFGSQMSIPQQQALNLQLSKAAAVNNGLDVIGRSQAVNPRFLVKPNGSIAQEDLDGHLDDMEVGLNSLKDLFKTNEYQMDNDTLIGLFNGSLPIENAENQSNQNQQIQFAAAGAGGDVALPGQEVVTYNPSLFELAEEDSNFFDESSNIFLDDELESMLTTDRDSLKRPEGHNRGVGLLSFSGVNLNNSIDSGLNTPVVSEPFPAPGAPTGSAKRKRK